MDPPVKFDDTAIAFSYKSDRELRKANFIFTVVNHPSFSRLATGAVRLGMSLHLPIKGLVKRTVFQHFCGGETIEKTDHTIQHLGVHVIIAGFGITFTGHLLPDNGYGVAWITKRPI